MESKKDVESMKQPGLVKRMVATGQLTRLTIYICTAVPSVIFLLLGLMVQFGVIGPLVIGGFVIGTLLDYVIFTILIATGVFGFYEAIRIHKVRKINDRFPDFVRDLAESRRAGMTFTKAIMYASRGNYGVLTPEIQKIARQISWGSSVDDALSSFAKRVNTKLIKRTISLIIEASRSGGNVADVLDAASRDAREIRYLEKERRASMLSYVAIIYVGVVVFLVIIVILTSNLIPAMLGTGGQGLQGTMGNVSNMITVGDINSLFFYAAMIQSIGMGVVAGIFEDGNFQAGIKHVFIMVLIGWIIFKAGVGI